MLSKRVVTFGDYLRSATADAPERSVFCLGRTPHKFPSDLPGIWNAEPWPETTVTHQNFSLVPTTTLPHKVRTHESSGSHSGDNPTEPRLMRSAWFAELEASSGLYQMHTPSASGRRAVVEWTEAFGNVCFCFLSVLPWAGRLNLTCLPCEIPVSHDFCSIRWGSASV